MSCGDLFLGLIAILFPPIAVWIKSGLCSLDSLINILLCMLGYLPGLLHAWYIIARHPERDYDYEVLPDAERQGGGQHGQHGGRVTYYYIRHEPRRDYGTQGQRHNRPAPPPPSAQGSNRPAPPPPSGNGSQQAPQGPSVGAGSDEPGAPPSYSEVVRGDNKIQTQE
ncbi:hypothetical protein A1O7_08090 [Cladophialophora yegresii CBS 114405]|uniref:Stress response RCI peptide n=1 Tax=Cladophialophora yegresii CBS 114405 TaxID=1182544 RepID=W9VQ68_9EURO|nr:uncharacterized protein A1O7_08090 [Cladophialophora yegresii CBS 114405]EXJ55165.1 hypothetical protein A1O7_08090 [Cladophialophora yegresii CBS 114405]